MKKIIYDLGAANGENLSYYLLKSDLVVAAEANKSCCDFIISKFKNAINEKRLIVKNCIISDVNEKFSDFYIHKNNYLLGQHPKPNKNDIENFKKIILTKRDIKEIIYEIGEPFYVKIDLEQYDHVVLKRIFDSQIYPNYISVEATNKNVIDTFIKDSKYKAFKLNEGKLIDIIYKNIKININNHKIKFSFPNNSAGPFGDDILDDWIDRENFIEILKIKKPGWWDIHGSLINKPSKKFSLDYYIKKQNKLKKKAKLIRRFYRIISKFNFLKNEKNF